MSPSRASKVKSEHPPGAFTPTQPPPLSPSDAGDAASNSSSPSSPEDSSYTLHTAHDDHQSSTFAAATAAALALTASPGSDDISMDGTGTMHWREYGQMPAGPDMMSALRASALANPKTSDPMVMGTPIASIGTLATSMSDHLSSWAPSPTAMTQAWPNGDYMGMANTITALPTLATNFLDNTLLEPEDVAMDGDVEMSSDQYTSPHLSSYPRAAGTSSVGRGLPSELGPLDQVTDGLQIRVLGVPSVGAKSRVETQIKLCLQLLTRDGEKAVMWQKLRLPEHMVATRERRRGTASAKGTGEASASAEDTPPPWSILDLEASVLCASSSSPTPVTSCVGCVQRERKRSLRKRENRLQRATGASGTEEPMSKKGTKEVDALSPAELEAAQKRILLFNCPRLVDFTSGDTILPSRITCYCRHHNERLGFRILFSIRDHTGRIVASEVSPPVMITDDHKSSRQVPPPPVPAPDLPPPHSSPGNLAIPPSPIGGSMPHSPLDRPPGSVSSIGLSPTGPHRRSSSVGGQGHGRGQRGGPIPAPFPSTGQRYYLPYGRPQGPEHPYQMVSPSLTEELQSGPLPSAGLDEADKEMGLFFAGIQFGNGFIPSPTAPTEAAPLSPAAPSPSSPGQRLDPIHIDDATIKEEAGGLGLLGPMEEMASEPEAPLTLPLGPGGSNPLLMGEGMGQTAQLAAITPHSQLMRAAASLLPARVPVTPRQVSIDRVVPGQGPTIGGVEITVLGSGFFDGCVCVFGDAPAEATQCWSSSTLVCLLPPAAASGTVEVRVQGQRGSPAGTVIPTRTGTFTYVDGSERMLMELALQVVGMKMTGQLEDARQVAMRIVASEQGQKGRRGNGNTGAQDDEASGGPIASLLREVRGEGEAEETKGSSLDAIILAALRAVREMDGSGDDDLWSQQDSSQHTLLHYAVARGAYDLAKFLLDVGCDVDAQDYHGFTALHFAALTDRPDMAQLLLEVHGGVRDSRSNEGLTAAEIAEAHGHAAVLATLQDGGGYLTATEEEGEFSSMEGSEVDEDEEAPADGDRSPIPPLDEKMGMSGGEERPMWQQAQELLLGQFPPDIKLPVFPRVLPAMAMPHVIEVWQACMPPWGSVNPLQERLVTATGSNLPGSGACTPPSTTAPGDDVTPAADGMYRVFQPSFAPPSLWSRQYLRPEERRQRLKRDRLIFLFWLPMLLVVVALSLFRFIATDPALQERVWEYLGGRPAILFGY